MSARTKSRESFLFTPLAARPVQVFRIALAVALVYFFLPGPSELGSWVRQQEQLYWLYLNVFPSTIYHLLAFACLGVVAAGWRPRLFGLLALILLLPLSQFSYAYASRQPMLVTLACFLLVDSRRGSENPGPIWPIRLIQLQLSLIYLVNAAVKTHPAYLRGDVLLGLATTLPYIRLEVVGEQLVLGRLAFPAWLAAWGTVLTEYFLAVAFWFRRLRWVAAGVGIAFHISLMFVINIYNLDWATMFLYLAFLIPWHRTEADRSHHRTAA